MTIQTAKTVRILKRRLEDLLLTLLVVLCLSACQFGQRNDLTLISLRAFFGLQIGKYS